MHKKRPVSRVGGNFLKTPPRGYQLVLQYPYTARQTMSATATTPMEVEEYDPENPEMIRAAAKTRLNSALLTGAAACKKLLCARLERMRGEAYAYLEKCAEMMKCAPVNTPESENAQNKVAMAIAATRTVECTLAFLSTVLDPAMVLHTFEPAL